MSPNDYRLAHELTWKDWADRLGFGVTYVHEVGTGRKPASRNLALAIARDTDGAVSLEDVFAAYAPDPTPGEGAAA